MIIFPSSHVSNIIQQWKPSLSNALIWWHNGFFDVKSNILIGMLHLSLRPCSIFQCCVFALLLWRTDIADSTVFPYFSRFFAAAVACSSFSPENCRYQFRYNGLLFGVFLSVHFFFCALSLRTFHSIPFWLCLHLSDSVCLRLSMFCLQIRYLCQRRPDDDFYVKIRIFTSFFWNIDVVRVIRARDWRANLSSEMWDAKLLRMMSKIEAFESTCVSNADFYSCMLPLLLFCLFVFLLEEKPAISNLHPLSPLFHTIQRILLWIINNIFRRLILWLPIQFHIHKYFCQVEPM